MAYDYAGAINAGAAPSDVGNYLAKQTGYNFDGATKAGANVTDVLKYMSTLPNKTATPPTPPATQNPLVQTGTDLVNKTNAHAAAITQDFSDKPSFAGAADITGHVAGEAGDILGSLIKTGAQATMPKPIYDFLSNLISEGVKAVGGSSSAQGYAKEWGKLSAQYPEITKSVAGIAQAAGLVIGGDGAPTAEETANIVKQGAGVAKDIVTNAPRGTSAAISDGTEEAITNIAKQEGGIVAPAKTAAQIAQESQAKTWDIIKPKLTPSEMNEAAASGKIARTGETGVVTQVPTATDAANIKLAQPYVEAAGGDPIKTVSNIKQGIATEADKLRSAVGTQGGTFSTSNVQGAISKVKIPLAIKGSAEMTQVENIKNYVTELASKVDKNPSGALDLSQKFRQGINSEFGENIWGKGTPISNYIKSVNKALNDFISTRLPDGKLPDGTLIKDSFAKQSKLYDIMENIQVPKLGEAAINPTEEAPLKVPGSPLEETAKKFGKEHPIIKGTVKTVGKAVGLGAGVHLVP